MVGSKRAVLFLRKAVILLAIGTAIINLYITARTTGYVYTVGPETPKSTYGLVLGTSKYVTKGGSNKYYEQRIAAAAALFKLKKIDTIIVSGDHREPSYNEPARMKASLVELGIPRSVVLMDGEGTDTQRSILGFGQRHKGVDVTIITQRFHIERAVYYALEEDIRAIGAKASDGNFLEDPKMYLREYFAKIKAFFN